MNICAKPCKDCPFTKTSMRGWLGDVYNSPAELHAIVMTAELPFSCHMVQKKNISWDEVGNDENPVCAGAIAYLKKNFKHPKDPRLAKLVAEVDRTKLDNIMTVPEFHEHHSKINLYATCN